MRQTWSIATLIVAATLAAGSGAARAQLVLPGAAVPPTPAGGAQPATPLAPGLGGPKAPPAPMAAKVAGEETLIGRPLFLNGTRGRIVVDRAKDGLQIRIIAVGEKISKPVEACGVDLGGGQPLSLKADGRPQGVPRQQLTFDACPVTFDVLDGAVLASAPGVCTFQESDCRVDPRGLWGPAPSALEGQRATIEADRSKADKAVRENYKALLFRAKGKEEIRKVVSEQAGFTSERETLCRDYVREPGHGFCGSRFTELRAASLLARLNRIDGKPDDAQPKPKPKPRPKPPDATASAPPGGPAFPPPLPPQ